MCPSINKTNKEEGLLACHYFISLPGGNTENIWAHRFLAKQKTCRRHINEKAARHQDLESTTTTTKKT